MTRHTFTSLPLVLLVLCLQSLAYPSGDFSSSTSTSSSLSLPSPIPTAPTLSSSRPPSLSSSKLRLNPNEQRQRRSIPIWRRTLDRILRRNDKDDNDRPERNVPPEGYYNPLKSGGSTLTSVPGTFPEGLGEPLNVILSGNSDAAVLVDQEIDGGLRNYFLSIGFSGECLGQNAGMQQSANLGDGNGYKNQTSVIRWNYGDPELGSCRETIEGGNHFRYWVQDGKDGNSGAVFMAASVELPISLGHDIVVNGYNLGRDEIVGNATAQPSPISTSNLTNSSTYSGTSSWNGFQYQTDVIYVSGMLQNSSDGINHYLTVSENGKPAVDGLVAVMTVKVLARPVVAASHASSIFEHVSSTLRTSSLFSIFVLLTTTFTLFL